MPRGQDPKKSANSYRGDRTSETGSRAGSLGARREQPVRAEDVAVELDILEIKFFGHVVGQAIQLLGCQRPVIYHNLRYVAVEEAVDRATPRVHEANAHFGDGRPRIRAVDVYRGRIHPMPAIHPTLEQVSPAPEGNQGPFVPLGPLAPNLGLAPQVTARGHHISLGAGTVELPRRKLQRRKPASCTRRAHTRGINTNPW